MTNFPTTLEEAADYILAQMDEFDRDDLRAMARHQLILCHSSLGMEIRNSLKLWEPGNPIVADSGISYPDNCSMAIVERIWEKLQRGIPG